MLRFARDYVPADVLDRAEREQIKGAAAGPPGYSYRTSVRMALPIVRGFADTTTPPTPLLHRARGLDRACRRAGADEAVGPGPAPSTGFGLRRSPPGSSLRSRTSGRRTGTYPSRRAPLWQRAASGSIASSFRPSCSARLPLVSCHTKMSRAYQDLHQRAEVGTSSSLRAARRRLPPRDHLHGPRGVDTLSTKD